MNLPNNNKSNARSGNSASRKMTRRVAIVIILIISIALIASLAFILNRANTSTNNSSTTQTDMQLVKDSEPADKNADSKPAVAPEVAGTTITTGDSEFGTMLFNENKQAIYIFELEKSAQPECYDDCAKAWPPVLTDGKPVAAGAVNSSLLGTTKRTDGSVQVTYNGHPLYYYAHEGPGEVECHNVSSYGGLWWVIQPNGNRAN